MRVTVDSQLRSPEHSRVQYEMEGLVMSDDFEAITTAVGEAFTRQDAEGIARALDRERKEKGSRGPLHGIPVLLKDIDVANRFALDSKILTQSWCYLGFHVHQMTICWSVSG